MASTTLFDRTGKDLGSVELHDDLFSAPVNEAVLHQVVTAQLAGRRTGTADTKTRGEVRGGGKKPYRQKGTGRARQGTRTAPHYRGGGAVFGPHPRSYEQKLPRKMKRLALRGALTAKLGDEAIRVIDSFGLEAIKTASVLSVLSALNATGRVLVVAPASDETLRLSAPQPADGRGDPRGLPQRRRHPERRHARHRAAGARPDGGGLPVSALTAPEIILRPVVSEKSIDQSTRGRYTFRVHPDANKIQIKAAIEELYAADKVSVVAVNVLTTKSKKKSRGTRRGRIEGHTSPWRKAVVTLAAGQKIQFFEGV